MIDVKPASSRSTTNNGSARISCIFSGSSISKSFIKPKVLLNFSSFISKICFARCSKFSNFSNLWFSFFLITFIRSYSSKHSLMFSTNVIRLRGLEPLTFGSVDRCLKIVTIVKTKTYSKSNPALTNQLTNKIQKQGKMSLLNYRQTLPKS